MKAYVLRNDGFEFLWSWEAGAKGPPPNDVESPDTATTCVLEEPPEAPVERVESSEEPALEQVEPLPDAEAGVETRLQGLEDRIRATLLALERVVRTHGEDAADEERDESGVQGIESGLRTLEGWTGELSRRVEALERRSDKGEEQASQVAAQVEHWEGHAATAFAAVEHTLRDQNDRIAAIEGQSTETARRSQELGSKVEDLKKRGDTAEAAANAALPAQLADQKFQEFESRIAAMEAMLAEQAAQLRRTSAPAEPTEPRSYKRLVWLLVSACAAAAAILGYANRGLAEMILSPQAQVTQPPAYRAAIPAPELTPVPAPAQDSVSAAAPAAAAQQGMSVVVQAKLDAWIEVQADGATVFAKMLPAGDAKTFPAGQQVKIRAGNLGGIDVSLNGKPLGPLGSGRKVGTVLITPAGLSSVRQ